MPTKKQHEKGRAANEPFAARSKKSKTKKKERPRMPGAKYFPAKRITYNSLPASGGYEFLSVPSDLTGLASVYNPEVIRQIFHGLFAELLKSVSQGQSHTFRAPETGLDMKVMGIALDQTVGEFVDEATFYADLAVAIFKEKIVYALNSFSDQLLLQVIIATLDRLLKGGRISLSENFHLKEIWHEYLSSYEKAMKAHWAPMARGQRTNWPPVKLLALAKAHESNEATAKRLLRVYESKDSRRWRTGLWKDEVRREFDGSYDWVLDQIPTQKEKFIALLLTSKQFGLYKSETRNGVAGIGKRLREAAEIIERRDHPDDHIPPYDEDVEESSFTIVEDE
jgi:hypothetical protein